MHSHIEIDQIYIERLKKWKKTFWKGWKNKNTTEQIIALKLLAKDLNRHIEVENAMFYSYKNRKITLNVENPSLLSTLHEIAHSIFGESEKQATIWSKMLFKQVFYRDFIKLKEKRGIMVR